MDDATATTQDAPKAKKKRVRHVSPKYLNYINSIAWRLRREDYYTRHERKCADCGETRCIHLHHKTYKRLGREKDKDLKPLCKWCHAKRHPHMLDPDTEYHVGEAPPKMERKPKGEREPRYETPEERAAHLALRRAKKHARRVERALAEGKPIPEPPKARPGIPPGMKFGPRQRRSNSPYF